MKNLKYRILINKTGEQFSSRGFECMVAIVLALGTLGLLAFVPFIGVAVTFIVAPFLCIGVKKYLISICKDDFLPVESIFMQYKLLVRAFCLKVAYTLICLLWGIVFIIPGIICTVNYSMASFVMAENPELSSLECMAKSKKLVSGNRAEIFVIYLAYIFVTFVAMCIFVALGIAIKSNTLAPLWVTITLMIITFLFIFTIFIVPYFELVITNAYLELKGNDKKKATNSQTVKQQEKLLQKV